MIRTEPIIAVENVQKSSKWYQTLLGCKSDDGGNTFDILKDPDGTVILCLHKWGEHEHPTMMNSKIQAGNGLILYIRIDNLKKIWEKAQKMKVVIDARPRLNPISGMEEFAIRDLDGYYLLISE